MAVGAAYYPNNSGTYIKNHGATGHLITQYARNPKDFPFARYVQYREVKQDSGYYLRMTAEQAARMVNGSLDEFIWPDGADRPKNNNGTESFAWADYRTERFAFPWTLGDKARKQAGWSIEDTEAANHAQQAMTARTLRMHLALQSSGNWDSGHTIAASAIPGNVGRWNQSTTSRMDIKRSINYAHKQIRLATLGVVKSKKDMRLVMSPTAAQKIGESQEMINAFIQSLEARKHWEGKYPDYSEYGIPPILYGIEVVVEDAVMVTSRRGASTVVKSDVCSDSEIYLVSRPGGLTAKSSTGPSYSSCMCFTYEDMTVEQRQDPDNRRVDGTVVFDSAEQIVAPASSFRFTDVIS